MKRYVSSAEIATPNVETTSVGIQNKIVLKNVFPSRLAAKNNAENKTARTHNRGEEKNATKTLSPVALSPLMSLRTGKKSPPTRGKSLLIR